MPTLARYRLHQLPRHHALLACPAADVVGQVGGAGDLPEGEVGGQADFELADLFLQAKRTGSVAGHALQGFEWRHAE